jgi:hypothetical protein
MAELSLTVDEALTLGYDAEVFFAGLNRHTCSLANIRFDDPVCGPFAF